MSATPRSSVSPKLDMQGRVSDSSLDYLLISLVQHYQQQTAGPPSQVALSAIGFRLGRVLAERLARDRPPMLDQLEILKGTYVLRDTQFRWTLRLSQNLVSQPERLSPNDLAAVHLVLPCAAIRGALAALGMEATVTADATTLPQCDFTVVVHTTAQGPATTALGSQ
ncbi:hypothetical protein Ndes2526A_g01364 [Nannochloris sp. 'desiccata']